MQWCNGTVCVTPRRRGGVPIPEMIVSPLSSSLCTRKVGSSLVKRPRAFEKFLSFFVFGCSASDTTGSGTNMLVIELRTYQIGQMSKSNGQ